MGGTDSIKGFDYQVTYCVLRILELIIQNESHSTELLFESLNEEEEDFNILRASVKEFTQIKKRNEGNHWTLADIKVILSKFIDKDDGTTEFVFVTNGTGNPDVVSLKKSIANAVAPNTEIIDKLAPSNKNRKDISSLLKRTKIYTRFGISDDDNDPAKILRSECTKLLNQYPFKIEGGDINSVYNSIWKLIFDYSRESKKVELSFVICEFQKLGMSIEESIWSTQIEIAEFAGRDDELEILSNSLEGKQVLSLNGINGIGKTWTTIKLLNRIDKLDSTCWISINQWTTISNIQHTLASYLFSANKHFLANKVKTGERIDIIPAIIDSLQNFEYILVFDSLNSGSNEIQTFVKEFVEASSNQSFSGKVILSSTETIFTPRTQIQKSLFTEFDLVGFSLEETKIILSELANDFNDDQIEEFHNSIGGHPMSIFFLKDLYQKKGIDEGDIVCLTEKSIEECRDYIIEKSIMTLDENSKNHLFSLSVFKGTIDWAQCDAQIDSLLNSKTALYPLLHKRLLLNRKSDINMHDSIRAVCQSIISVDFKKKLLIRAKNYIFQKMEADLDGPEGVLYEDLIKWSDLLLQQYVIESVDEKYGFIFELSDLELDALWAIRRYGFPFDYETEDLSSSDKVLEILWAKDLIKENDNPERVRLDEALIYDLDEIDYWQECLIIALCMTKGLSNHMGYIPVFKKNHAAHLQFLACGWEHCIEFMPLPPLPRSQRIEHQKFVKEKYEKGEYKDKSTEQLEFLLSIINKTIPDDTPEEKDLEMEASSCPIFGHCCPGGKEQAQECRMEIEDYEKQSTK
ncbi:MAG: dsDNA nuclease domain-containing protein [Chitinophagaceae bacterium]|jgi:hypothetical protein